MNEEPEKKNRNTLSKPSEQTFLGNVLQTMNTGISIITGLFIPQKSRIPLSSSYSKMQDNPEAPNLTTKPFENTAATEEPYSDSSNQSSHAMNAVNAGNSSGGTWVNVLDTQKPQPSEDRELLFSKPQDRGLYIEIDELENQNAFDATLDGNRENQKFVKTILSINADPSRSTTDEEPSVQASKPKVKTKNPPRPPKPRLKP